ncbi:unnamed protein product [Echinostoma caproni]|uniref:Reverse transcriptase n=1 Tax=Echinostoma caproni TaxID=27848 RepID=A0A183B8V2_9TREM|nr:unnamed protein product [Echinostoma caproni]
MLQDCVSPSSVLEVDGQELAEVGCFSYLGSFVTNDDSATKETTAHISKARVAYAGLKHLWRGRDVSLTFVSTFEDVGVWTVPEEFEDVTELAGIRTDRVRLTALLSLIKSRARTELDATRRGSEITWAASKDALISGFDTPTDSQEALRRLKTAQFGVGVELLSHAVFLHNIQDMPLYRHTYLMDVRKLDHGLLKATYSSEFASTMAVRSPIRGFYNNRGRP